MPNVDVDPIGGMIERSKQLRSLLNDKQAQKALEVTGKQEAFGTAASAAVPSGSEAKVATMLRIGADEGAHKDDRIIRYDSVYSFLEACTGPVAHGATPVGYSFMSNADRHKQLLKQSHPLGIKWEGFTKQMTFEQAKAFWFGGWPEGVEKMRQALDQVEAPVTTDIRRRPTWGDNGSELSTDRLYSGAWDSAWRGTTRRRVTAPTRVRIVVDMGCSCGACNQLTHDAQIVEPETLFWRGAAAANLAESLEAAGFAVEVVVAAAANWANFESKENGYFNTAGYPNHGILSAAVTVKGFGEPLDIASLTSVVSSSTFFRRAFLLWELTQAPYTLNPNYGNLLRIENEPRLCDELGLIEENVATVFVSDWVLTAPLANAWARGTHAGLESVNDPETAAEEMEGAS